ncbi:MAG: zinc-ribbon domain-containing protein [Solobacterium sp.]|nr:zinc-ribbon domain-containing protein [Solobacterium sp.]
MRNKQKRKVCGNCGSPYREGDKYCRYCGSPMGKPEFIDDYIACIYGPPPIKRTHVCSQCGYTWSTTEMIDNTKFCPECGSPAPVQEKEPGAWVSTK